MFIETLGYGQIERVQRSTSLSPSTFQAFPEYADKPFKEALWKMPFQPLAFSWVKT